MHFQQSDNGLERVCTTVMLIISLHVLEKNFSGNLWQCWKIYDILMSTLTRLRLTASPGSMITLPMRALASIGLTSNATGGYQCGAFTSDWAVVLAQIA